jgi:hypothetical protein
MPEFSFLTNRAKTLLAVAHDLRIRILDIARLLDLTERRTQRIVADVARTGCSERVSRDTDPSAAVMDARGVKTVKVSADISGYDSHKRFRGRKRHLLIDLFHPADRSDPPRAPALLPDLTAVVAPPRRSADPDRHRHAGGPLSFTRPLSA